ncbi:ribonuclease H-like domain-containing protein, partial [Tanacetum coccineum]
MTPDQPSSYDFLLPTVVPTPPLYGPNNTPPAQLQFLLHPGPSTEPDASTNQPTTPSPNSPLPHPTTEPNTPGPTPTSPSLSPTPNTQSTPSNVTASSNAPNALTTHTHHMVTRAKAGISKPLERMNCHATTTSPIPRSYLHALRDPHWHKVIVDEYNALISNGTWALMPRLANVIVVRSMWLFRHKY